MSNMLSFFFSFFILDLCMCLCVCVYLLRRASSFLSFSALALSASSSITLSPTNLISCGKYGKKKKIHTHIRNLHVRLYTHIKGIYTYLRSLHIYTHTNSPPSNFLLSNKQFSQFSTFPKDFSR